MAHENTHDDVLGFPISALDATVGMDLILRWAQTGSGGYVCIPNAHVLHEAQLNPQLSQALFSARMLLPDSMVLQKARAFLHGRAPPETLYGVALLAELCTKAEALGVKVGLHGGAPHTLEALAHVLKQRHPTLQIAYAVSPPFGTPTQSDISAAAKTMRAAGVQLGFIGLGAPKQECWMHQALPDLGGMVLVGIGAAFDGLAGTVASPPRWMHQAGLSWAFRFASEPRRLWRRYLGSSPKFLAAVLKQKLDQRHAGTATRL
jgi:N-acetylglucosaminyldiphosphoundecaprenol N-acetyl-beta-D-mannosaminyltransferase